MSGHGMVHCTNSISGALRGQDPQREIATMPVLLKDAVSGEVYDVEEFSLVGRGEAASIRLADSSISRQHASIRREGSDYWIVDLGSANGTQVNDIALTAARVLRHGDRVQFGNAVFVFQQEDETLQGMLDDGKTTIALAGPKVARNVPATLFVADLRGFTQMSARMSSGEVADLLREWYADCNAILKQHGASIDKFIGDCVFAYWHGKDAEMRMRALRAAHALRAVEANATSPTRVLVKQIYDVTLDCRIGLHVGEVTMGTMGKGITTALGDAVNVAFRIESLTRVVDCPVLASRAFLSDWAQGEGDFEPRGFHAVKGLDAPIEVFAPRGLT